MRCAHFGKVQCCISCALRCVRTGRCLQNGARRSLTRCNLDKTAPTLCILFLLLCLLSSFSVRCSSQRHGDIHVGCVTGKFQTHRRSVWQAESLATRSRCRCAACVSMSAWRRLGATGDKLGVGLTCALASACQDSVAHGIMALTAEAW